MTIFDRRHRWGEPERHGSRISRTCRVCGKTDTYDTLIPDAVIEAFLRNAIAPNVYRTLLS